ncbi:hypothetical protein V6N11_026541 [Hibiscus sabdariffa]|uniref:NAC domain-containing protein n=1 Tax=Hibiscus sabdariffa TaxID=183260 RepID=A0ABR2SWW7_9ROSI
MEVWGKPNPGNMITSQPLHRASCSNGIVIYDASKNEEPTGYRAGDDDDYLDSFPPGFRFCPLDEELVLHYLKKKVMNLPLPQNRIMEVNLYRYNPEKLAVEQHKQYGEKEWYFFTPRDKKYPNGSRPNRAAGDGFWKATGADREVLFNDCVIGYRKALVFYNGKPPRGDKSNWIMHEYRVNDPPPRKERAGYTDMRLDDWVLCRIYKKLKKSGRTEAKTDVEEPVMEKPEGTDGEIIGLDDNEIIDYDQYFNPVNETLMDQSLVNETMSNIQHIYNEQMLPYYSTTCPNEMSGQTDNLWMQVDLCVEPLGNLDFSTDDDNYNNNNNNKKKKKKKKNNSEENSVDAKMDRRT